MKPIFQTIHSDPTDSKRGNCVQAATASILELDLNDVPNFIALTKPEEWEIHFRKFLKQYGFMGLRITGEYIADCYYLVVGKTNRSDDVRHMVVYHDGELAHDPHPSNDGLTEVTDTFLLVPHDPSKLLKGNWHGNDW